MVKGTAMAIDLDKVEQIFSEAAAITAGPERSAYLNEACRDDQDLRARVEALLKAHEQNNDRFLETGRLAHLPLHLLETRAEVQSVVEAVGTRIGRYKLLQL